MKYILNFKDKINEKLIHSEFDDVSDDMYIFSKDKYIYFVDVDSDIEELINKMFTKFEIGTMTDIYTLNNIYKLIDAIKDYFPNILMLKYNGGDYLYFELRTESNLDVNVSKNVIDTLKTLKNKLNVQYLVVDENIMNYEGNEDTKEYRYDIDILIDDFEKDLKYTKLPRYVYHGTCSRYFDSIIKIGIRPKRKSNFNNLYDTNEYIFMSSSMEDAYFYAEKSAKNTNSFPIIFKIDTSGLNKNLIDFDYDFYLDYIGKGHEYFNEIELKTPHTATHYETLQHLHDKYIGTTYRKFSYKGSVYPKYLVEAYYKDNYYDVFFDNVIYKSDFKEFVDFFYTMEELLDVSDFEGLNYDFYLDYKNEEEEENNE